MQNLFLDIQGEVKRTVVFVTHDLDEALTVVLRRMRQAGLSHIFVVDEERRLLGLCEAEEVARLAERDERELRAAVDDGAPRVGRRTPLREVLPLFVDDGEAPVAVVGEEDRLEGVIVRGALIAGLTTSVDSTNGGDEDFSGVGARQTSEVASDGGDGGGRG